MGPDPLEGVGCQGSARGRRGPRGSRRVRRPRGRRSCGAWLALARRGWRRGGDSNPRCRFRHTRFPSVYLKPLRHLSRDVLVVARATGRACAAEKVAERGGFEPPVPLRTHWFSKPARSAALSPLHVFVESRASRRGDRERARAPGMAPTRDTCAQPSAASSREPSRFLRKNVCRSSRASSARRPSVNSTRWFARGCVSTSPSD